jgi:hypothetical protein
MILFQSVIATGANIMFCLGAEIYRASVFRTPLFSATNWSRMLAVGRLATIPKQAVVESRRHSAVRMTTENALFSSVH